MAKLSAREATVLKVMIEGGAGESLYNRLQWNTAKNIRLSQEEKDVLYYTKNVGYLAKSLILRHIRKTSELNLLPIYY